MGISSIFRRYIDYQTANDHPLVDEIIRRKYFLFPKILGLYFDLKTTKGIVWTLTINIWNMTFLIFYIYVFIMTGVRSLSWSLGYSMQSFNYALMLVAVISIMYVPITNRRKLTATHYLMAIDMLRYHEEVISQKTSKVKEYVEQIMKYASFGPVFLVMGTFSMTLLLPDSERYVNGIDLSLPIGLWYPFYIDTTFTYVLVVISQLYLCHVYFSICIFCIIFAVGCTLYAVVQLMRLTDSINGLQFRAMQLMKTRYPSKSVNSTVEKLLLDECFAKCYLSCLKENFEHYKIIKSYLTDFQDSIGIPFLVLFASFSLVIGSGMFTLMSDDFIGPKINAALIGIMQICPSFVFCFIGQKITDSSVEMHNAVYGMEWPGSHRKIQVFAKIFILATTKPIEPSAFGLIGFSLNCFAGMTDVAYKAYNVLILLK